MKTKSKTKSDLEYITAKGNTHKCVDCKKIVKKKTKQFDKDLANRFQNTYKFCDGVLNKFCLIVRKGVYPYQYTDIWQRFSETLLPGKKQFYSSLIKEDIIDTGYKHAKRVRKDFKLQNLGEYHDFYVEKDTQLLADI